MKWEIVGKKNILKIEDVIKQILENRGIKQKEKINNFLNPSLGKITIKSVGINSHQFKKTLQRIKKAVKRKEKIVIFGDYDADGICATAILWEALKKLGANVLPYIPHRVDEGYGLSIVGIENLKKIHKDCSLIITVDNGIIANEAVDYAKEKGIDVIITDHHLRLEKLPKAYSIIHTTKLCGAGIAYLLANKLSKEKNSEYLELSGIATIADLVPLKEENRAIVKYALEALRKTKRTGLLEILKEAEIEEKTLGVYEISHIISPRINASGRIEKAMDSLRLLCTKDKEAARLLALKLGMTNKRRQRITEETLLHAKSKITLRLRSGQERKKLIFVYDEIYEQGIIGLVAGKLVEEYYLPSIVLAKGEKFTKASARSISGFNIIEFIREVSEFLVDAGGHPMAAGFTVENEKLDLVKEKLEGLAGKLLNKEKLTKVLRIDCDLPVKLINKDLIKEIKELEPFGMGNPQPVFISKKLTIEELRYVGKDKKHLKIKLVDYASNFRIWGIWFNYNKELKIDVGDKVDVVYTIGENIWNGYINLELKVKDIV